MVPSKKKKVGLLLVVLSAVSGSVLYVLGVPLFSAEWRNLSDSPNGGATAGHVTFHWPAILIVALCAIGVVLLVSSSREASSA